MHLAPFLGSMSMDSCHVTFHFSYGNFRATSHLYWENVKNAMNVLSIDWDDTKHYSESYFLNKNSTFSLCSE